MSEGVFDGELYAGEEPPGEETATDLPPGVHEVSETDALAAERRFLANTRREESRAGTALVQEMNTVSEAMRGSSDPLGTASHMLHTPDHVGNNTKPPRNPNKPIGYSDKAQRDARRRRRAEDGKSTSHS